MSFKSSMANYYHEARAQARKLKEIQEANKQKREQRAELPAEPEDHPVNQLEIHGRTVRLHRNADQAAALERGDGLIPWNGNAECMIDRFDGRALLDMYREPPAHALKGRTKTADEVKLEELRAFEAYRDLVRLTATGCTEAEGLKRVAEESLELRAAPKIAAAAALAAAAAAKGGFGGHAGAATAPAGAGMYSSLGFSYGGGGGGADGAAVSSSSSDDSDDDSDDSDDDADVAPANAEEAAQEAEDERLDTLAEAFGITDFSYRLHRTLEREGEEEARLRKRPKKAMGRKKAALRARRMAGRGLNPAGEVLRKGPSLDVRALINPWADDQGHQAGGREDRVVYQRRDSPDYEDGLRGGRRRSRSRSPARTGPEFITEFTSGGDAQGGDAMFGATYGQGIIIEALPDRPDPAMLGGFQPLTKEAFAVQGVKPEEARARELERQRQRDKEWEEERQREREAERRARDRSRERGRERSRDRRDRDRRSRSRSRSRGRDRGHDRHRRHSRSRSTDRGRGGGRHRDRSRSRSRGRGRSHSRERGRDGKGHGSSRDAGDRASHRRGSEGGGSANKQVPAAAAPRGPSAAQPAVPKESHAERLKRIMQAQLNKQQQKDHLVTTQKKIQAEKEKAARANLERVLPPPLRRSPSPNRSPSPSRRRRSRSPLRRE